MLNLILDIIDRLEKLAKYKDWKRQKLFKNLLEPLFNDLMIVHSDYIAMFEECSIKLRKSVPISEVGELLRKRRIEYEALREKVRSFSSKLIEMPFESTIKEFISVATAYLPSATLTHYRTPARRLLSEMHYYSDDEPIAVPKSEQAARYKEVLQESIQHEISNRRRHWAIVCEKFIRLKAEIL